MKSINNKGFILAETLVVTVFVMIMFMFLYRNSLPLVGEYERRENYDDLETVYAANEIKKLVMMDPAFDTWASTVKTDYYKDLSDCTTFSTDDLRILCGTLKQKLGMDVGSKKDYILLVTNDINRFRLLVKNGTVFNGTGFRAVKDYITYLPSITSTTAGYDQYYLIVSRSEILDIGKQEGDDVVYTQKQVQKFAYLEVNR